MASGTRNTDSDSIYIAVLPIPEKGRHIIVAALFVSDDR